MIEFGERHEGVDYLPRPGAYAVPMDARGRVAVVRTSRGHFLAGGGIDPGESPEDALRREVREETGRAVAVGALICEAVQYVRAHDGDFRKECVFFRATLVDGAAAPHEEDHLLVWLGASDAVGELRHGSQSWAVGRALETPG